MGTKKTHYLKNVKSKRNDFVGYYWDSKQSWLIYKTPMGKVLTKKNINYCISIHLVLKFYDKSI
jgi:hypothetical protein